MPVFVALLRGVNVGRAKRVPLAELRARLAELGYTRVSTVLNTGNAMFDAVSGSPARHASRSSAAIAARLEIDVPVAVKSAHELATIVSGNPWSAEATDPSRLLAAFTQDANTLRGLATIAALA